MGELDESVIKSAALDFANDEEIMGGKNKDSEEDIGENEVSDTDEEG